MYARNFSLCGEITFILLFFSFSVNSYTAVERSFMPSQLFISAEKVCLFYIFYFLSHLFCYDPLHISDYTATCPVSFHLVHILRPKTGFSNDTECSGVDRYYPGFPGPWWNWTEFADIHRICYLTVDSCIYVTLVSRSRTITIVLVP